jgi:predicted phosphatase
MPVLFAQLLGGLGNIFFIISNIYSLSIDRNMDFCVTNFTQSCTKRKEENKWIYDILKSVKKVNKRPKDVKIIYREREFSFQRIPDSKGQSMEIYGYYQSAKYFEHNRENIIELLTEYKKEIQNKLNIQFNYDGKTISLHIRRGDYLKLQHAHVVQDLDYYNTSLKRLAKELNYETVEKLNKDFRVMVFSDDIQWCNQQKIFKSLKNIRYMEKNPPIEDMYLMSMCNHHIIANSSFSWWGCYLNDKEGKKVIAPSKWFNPSYMKPEKWQDIYCKDWIIV